MSYDFVGLNRCLLAQFSQLMEDWLPGGRSKGREYVCGDINGGAGRSFSVSSDTGKWSDFASTVAGGDLISLYAKIRAIDNGEAYRQLGGEVKANEHARPLMRREDEREVEAYPPPNVDFQRSLFATSTLGSPHRMWVYRDARAAPLYVVVRWDLPDGKIVMPWVWDGLKWVAKAYPKPRPLYGLDRLARISGPVLLVEGEKAADAAHYYFGNRRPCMTWCGGCGQWQVADWSPLANRVVTIWPDNDKIGKETADKIAGRLVSLGCTVTLIDPSGFDESWDLADSFAAGTPKKELSDYAKTHGSLVEHRKPDTQPEAMSLVAKVNAAKRAPNIAQNSRSDAIFSESVTTADFYAYMPAHQYIFVSSRELWPAASIDARLPRIVGPEGRTIKPSAWLDANQAVEQMTWAPGEPMIIEDRLASSGAWIPRKGCRCFNLYREPTVMRGDAGQAARWGDHVRRVFPDSAVHIIQWLAHRVQRPGDKINHAIVMSGDQGIGKDTILEPIKHAVGPWNFGDVSPKQMTGRFNGFLKSVILRINEARDLGEFDRYAFYEHTKVYCAAPPDALLCDEKNLREHSVMNVLGIIITTNHRAGNSIYLPADDRRHYVALSTLTKDDFHADYWREMYDWFSSGGYGHVAAYLSALDLSNFNPKAPPAKTPAFWAIVDANRAPEDAELADVIDDLGHPPAVTLAMLDNPLADTETRAWLQDRRYRRQIPHRLESVGYSPVRNDGANDGLWKVGRRRQAIYARKDMSERERMVAANDICERARE